MGGYNIETTLTDVCKECNNHFLKSHECGFYTINDGVITLQNNYLVGQYILVNNSILNDGIYKVTDNLITLDGSSNESFEGSVYGLAIPRGFIDLVQQIQKQIDADKNDSSNKGLTNESYSNYSYSRATGANGVGASWKEIFASQLNKYRRMFPERLTQ